ncbi:hypothetical protein [Mycoplasmopsis felis]|uniref:hypothetical protein n=1 Tax=Mycoplasmopsis felis TaxID=33923 RepID=UPI002AFF5F5B|nr:hypothetical protein [Mycoplasmopsis felis]WQQ08355.1 hypothetical protein RRG61_03465 [Mycoplasmopsis felis]WQQ08741.1 hypothetical protein RRG61_01330 [Mycoplasmopsis felis]
MTKSKLLLFDNLKPIISFVLWDKIADKYTKDSRTSFGDFIYETSVAKIFLFSLSS